MTSESLYLIAPGVKIETIFQLNFYREEWCKNLDLLFTPNGYVVFLVVFDQVAFENFTISCSYFVDATLD